MSVYDYITSDPMWRGNEITSNVLRTKTRSVTRPLQIFIQRHNGIELRELFRNELKRVFK